VEDVGTRHRPRSHERALTTLHFGVPDAPGLLGTMSGTLACNRIGNTPFWTPEGRFIYRDYPLIFTQAGCDPVLHAFGKSFWFKMPRAQSWHRVGRKLTVVLSDGTASHLTLMPLPPRR
jgi:hypothetical protein